MRLTDIVDILGSREGVLDGPSGQFCAIFECIGDVIAGRARFIGLFEFVKAFIGRLAWMANSLDLIS